jgi:hypothetical protein
MKRSRVDPCICFGEGVIIFLYVDDIIIAGNTMKSLRGSAMDSNQGYWWICRKEGLQGQGLTEDSSQDFSRRDSHKFHEWILKRP